MVIALQTLPNPYFGGMLNTFALIPFKSSATFITDPGALSLYCEGCRGVKDCCCLSSKLSVHLPHSLASVWIKQNRLCGLDRPETRRWVDGHWPLLAFRLQELKRHNFNKATNQSHVWQQGSRWTAGLVILSWKNEQAPAREEWQARLAPIKGFLLF